jgi:hypothetical protein
MAMKWLLFMLGGVCWFVFGLGFGLLLLACIAQAGGLQDMVPWLWYYAPGFYLGDGLIFITHLVGLLTLTGFCFLFGVALFSYGLALRGEKPAKNGQP